MGDRWRPKSGAGMGGGGYDPDEYGRGAYDPATGLYEWYEPVPEDVKQAVSNPGTSWVEVLEQWKLLVASFHAEFGVDLEEVQHAVTWRWFAMRVAHLLSTDTPFGRHFGYRSRLEQLLEAVFTRSEE